MGGDYPGKVPRAAMPPSGGFVAHWRDGTIRLGKDARHDDPRFVKQVHGNRQQRLGEHVRRGQQHADHERAQENVLAVLRQRIDADHTAQDEKHCSHRHFKGHAKGNEQHQYEVQIAVDIGHHLHVNKQVWLNPTAWTIRSIVYFSFWTFGTRFLTALSLRQDSIRDEALGSRRTNFAAPAGVIHVFMLTFAMTDWVMSLDPMFISTLYGAWHMATGLLFMIAIGTFIVTSLRNLSPYNQIVKPQLIKDLGNLMLGFTMVYGYFTLSQFLIIWSGNLPEEIWFFIHRFQGPMVYVGTALVICQFVIPFLLLISGKTKRTPKILRFVAAWIAIVRIVDLFWQVVPFMVNFSGWIVLPVILGCIGALAGIGGIWVYAFSGALRKYALVPSHDPRLVEAKLAWEAQNHAA